MTMTRKSAWTLVGIVVVGSTAVIASVAGLVWAGYKLWVWFAGPGL